MDVSNRTGNLVDRIFNKVSQSDMLLTIKQFDAYITFDYLDYMQLSLSIGFDVTTVYYVLLKNNKIDIEIINRTL